MTCVNCGAGLPPGGMFCGECGRAVSRIADVAPCESCGARMAAVDIFCGKCGHVARAALLEGRDTGAQPTVPIDPVSSRSAGPHAPGVAVDPNALPRPGEPLRPVEELVLPGTEIPLDGPAPIMVPTRASGTAPEVAAPPTPLRAEPASSTGSASALAPAIEQVPTAARSSGQPRQTLPRFVLQFSTGESITVSGTGLIGRNPTAEPGEYFDNLVRILDLTRSVSKTHLEFGCERGDFWLADRYSGNGTVLRPPERSASRAAPGKRYRLPRGSRVDIGEQFFVVS